MQGDRSLSGPGGSLKFRYLVFAALVSFVLVAGSVAASLYVASATENSTRTLQMHDQALENLNGIRKAIWWVDSALNTRLITPRSEDAQTVRRNLDEARERLDALAAHPVVARAGLEWPIAQLRSDLGDLTEHILQLMALQKDPDWVYPMLPFINETLLESNEAFELAATLALDEIAEEDGERYASPLFREIAEIRDLWRQQILDFRVIIIRFAGLNRERRIVQENNLAVRHEVIMERLARLARRLPDYDPGPATEEAVATMRQRAAQWHADYLDLQKIRDSNIWRADVRYIEVNVHPLQLAVEDDLSVLTRRLQTWSRENVGTLELAANQITAEQWLLTLLTLAFVWLMYGTLSRSVLTPIARIARTLASPEGGSAQLRLAEQGSSREILTLVSAFNAMRQQLHHRQNALQHQALHDALTGLPNRALLQDRLEQAIRNARRDGSQVALLLLDLDRFKEINDTLGHATGDKVLQIIAERLEQTLRNSDTVARLGGDEFAIVCPQTDRHSLQAMLDKIGERISQPLEVEEQNLYVGASIGVAMLPEHGDDAETLIRHADIAMYAAKRGNRRHAYYSPDMETLSVDNLSLLGDLRAEITRPSGQLQIHYQPQTSPDGRPHSAEALLRWAHPEHGYQPPEQIIHMAEQAGLIGELTTWVLRQAVGHCADWQREGLEVGVAVNLSAWNLQDPKLPALIQRLLNETWLPPGRLTLEITESAVMSDPVRAREVLHELHAMGVQLAIDDYGTGFSSLAYLKMLPVGELKIDKGFVIDMLTSENDAIIVHSTVELAHNLKLRVVAEGVEEQESLERLAAMGCDYVQGYHVSRPLSESEFRRWCRQRQGHRGR